MPYAPTLTVYNDAAPCPRVEILFTQFHPDAATVTVYRLADRREMRVRSAVNASTAGALTRLDFEVPFGVPVLYRAEMFDSDGLSLGFTDTAETTVETGACWIHNPLNPAGAVRVDIDNSSALTISRPVEGEIVYPRGRRVGVVVSGQRRGVTGIELLITTDTDQATDRFRDLLGTYISTTVPVLCIRTPRQLRIPRVFFANVMDTPERPINAHLDGQLTEWDAVADEAAAPAEALIVPLLSRADINAFYATRTALNADNLNRLAVNRRYDLGGTA